MDVRCEKCGTEYELDETRLKPGGVTVKCTSCGHMFKIRKRATTNLGVPVIPTPGAPADRAARPSTGGAVPRPGTETGSGPNAERNWIIRMANGEQRSCRELATLQQWIIQGLVKRDSMISRSGKTWKQLGDIPELAQFFGVAEEAQRPRRDSARITSPQQAQRGRESKPATDVASTTLGMGVVDQPRPRPRTQPPPPPKALAGHAGPMAPLGGAPANDTRPAPPKPGAPPATPAPKATAAKPGVAAPPFIPVPQQPPSAQKPATFTRPAASPSSAPVPPVPALGKAPASARSTGAWANESVRPMEAPVPGQPDTFRGMPRSTGDEAGFVGQVRAVPTHDAAFVSSMGGRGRQSGRFEDLAPSEILDDDSGPVVARSGPGGLGKWIAIGSLALIAGATVAIYFIVVRQSSPKPNDQPVAVAGDGGPALTDAGGQVTPDVPTDDPVAAAREALFGDSAPDLTEAGKELAGAPQDVATEALRARLLTARAQGANDEAELRDPKTATKLKADAKKLVAEAMPLAQKAAKTKSTDVLAQVAMADVLRLQGKPPKEVRVYLDRAFAIAVDDREARLVEALLLEAEKKPADARKIYEQLAAGEVGDVRPRVRLALLSYAAGDAPAAQQSAEDVIAVQDDHVVASLLLAKLRDTVATGDPMPPEEDIDAGVKSGSGDGSSSGSGSGTASGTSAGSGSGSSRGTGSSGGSKEPSGDYDSLLAKADHLAEINCDDAMPYYAKALEVKPNGVAALTGRGYCYIDSKQFSSAHSSFRAALAVSKKYEPALWGIAEAYQQQGLKDKAIEAFQNYLQVYPGTAKAIKQLDKLGVSATDGGGGDPPPDDPPKDPPPDDPPAEDPPAEDPAPSDG